ncbi:MAG: TonB-dependent receptor [Prolixibacteraceae bacterium]|nr:TonB-dependent receptor [Prolixibacteraceae bacterium]
MKKGLLLLLLIVLYGIANAQQNTVTGTVTSADDGSTLPGVSVAIKGTTKGTITDIDGKYSLVVDDADATLLFAYVGMRNQEIALNGRQVIDIALETDVMGVDEVVVVGYGVTKKSLVTGAIAKMGSEDIEKTRSTRIENALQGKTAGVLVQQSSGAPGAEQNIIIRGVGSDNSVRPIYVIDGMRTDGIDWLDPQDIESVEILKDAASAAIYGTEGGNGVVLITTKMGRGGKTNLSYDASYGIQSVASNFKTLDTEGYLNYYRTALINDDLSGKTTWEKAMEVYPDSEVNTNWLDEIFNPAPMQKHKIGVDGGTDKSKYYFSLSYTNQDGIIGGGQSNFTRYATKFNLDSKATDWLTLGARVSYTHSRKKGIHQNDVFGSVTNNAVVLDPTTPVYYNDISEFSDRDRNNMEKAWGPEWYLNPTLFDENGYFGISQNVLNEIQNPIRQLYNDRDQDIINKLFGGVYAEIDFFEGLKFRTNFDIDMSHNYNRGWSGRGYTNSMNAPGVRSTATQQINMYFTWQWEGYFTYNKQIGDHNVGAVLGTSAREYTHEYLGGRGADLKKETDNYAWIDYGLYIDTLNNTAWGGLGGWERNASVFGRLSWSYKDKYMMTSNFRRDGSSKFGPANKFGVFPSVSVGWVVSREDFFDVDAISFLKVRYSWGKNGVASSLGWDWRYLPTSSSGAYFYLDGNNQILPVTEPSRLVNPEYQWEKTEQSDFGLDMGLFQNRLTFAADYYIKKSSDFLFEGSVPVLAGNDPPTVNAGTIVNKGIELELGYNDRIGDLKYNIKLTASHNKSEVAEITESISFITGGNIGTFGDSKRFEVGYEPWYFYGYETDGLFQTQEEVDAHANADGKLYQGNAKPGDVKYLDIAGLPDSLGGGPDGKLTDLDKTYLGSPYPKIVGGLNINLEYKGFDFNLGTYGQYGNKTLLAVSVRNDLANTNKPDFFLTDAWKSPEEQGSFPRPTVRDRNSNFSRINEYMLQDGSFLRINNVTLGYTLPENLLAGIGISRIRIYAAVDNLYTFTNYKGMEPEVGGDYWGYRGQQWAGIDRAVYPKARTILGGINVNF